MGFFTRAEGGDAFDRIFDAFDRGNINEVLNQAHRMSLSYTFHDRQAMLARADELVRAVAQRRRAGTRGRSERYHDHYDLATAHMLRAGIYVAERRLDGVWGLSQGNRILIHAGLSHEDRLQVLFHELAHEVARLLHGWRYGSLSHATVEFEADSVAIALVKLYGLTPTYTVSLVETWRRQVSDIDESLRWIAKITEQCLSILHYHERDW